MSLQPWPTSNWPKGVPREISGYDKPLFSFLDDSARKYPDKTYTIFNGAERSFAKVKDTADRIATAPHAEPFRALSGRRTTEDAPLRGMEAAAADRIEITIDGRSGRIFECPVDQIVATVVAGGRLYFFSLSHERSDARAFFDAWVATIELTPETAAEP